MKDVSDAEYLAQFLSVWPPSWPPPESVEVREGEYREGEYREGFSAHFKLRASKVTPSDDLKVSQKVSKATTSEEEWLRDYVDNSEDSYIKIAGEIGISKRCLEQRLKGETPIQRRTLQKIREFQSKQKTKAT